MPPATRRQTRQSTGAVVAAPAPEPTQSDPELSGDDGGKFFEESGDDADEPQRGAEPQRGKGRKQAPRPRTKRKVAMSPATRRQTRQHTRTHDNTAAAALAPDPSRSDPELSGDDDGEFFEASEDEADELQRAKGPKRARVSTKGGKRQRTQAEKESKLLKLSPELLDQILVFTHPKSLMRLAWTCKKLSAKLMSRESAGIWIAARTGCEELIPECPADVSELCWASLLFGPKECFTCGTPNVHTIIFPFRRRACKACMRRNMMWESKFKNKFPAYEPEILDLLPYSNISPWSHGKESTGRFFWEPDITALLATLGGYHVAIRRGEAGAQEALNEWKADRRVLSAQICEEVDALIAWSKRKGDAPQAQPRDPNVLHSRKQIVEAKLLEEGWEKCDIDRLNYQPSGTPLKGELTAGGWTTIKKKLEPQLREIQQRRIVPAREQVGRASYHAYAKTLPASKWAVLPPADEVLDMQPFADVIKGDPTIAVADAHFARAREQLPVLLNQWLREKKQSLVEGLVLPSFSDVPTAVNLARPDDLYLAVAVFVCATPRLECGSRQKAGRVWKILPKDGVVPFIGLEEILRHTRRHDDMWHSGRLDWLYKPHERAPEYSMKFNERGCAAALGILRALQRDPRTTRPMDLDKVKARFQCAHCVRTHPDDLGFVVMDWRRCISHFIVNTDAEHAVPSWTVYTATEATQVWFDIAESHDRTGERNRSEWACVHCSEYYLNPCTFSVVERHVKEVHRVYQPEDGDDIIWVVNVVRPMRSPVIIAPSRPLPPVPKAHVPKANARQAAPATTVLPPIVISRLPARPMDLKSVQVWRCVVCRNANDRRQNRKFNDSTGVMTHVKSVHDIAPQYQVEGTHFCMES